MRSLNKAGAADELENQIEKYNMDIVALQEIKWTGNGTKKMKNGMILYSGRNDGLHYEGTGFYVSDKVYQCSNNLLRRLRCLEYLHPLTNGH